MRFESNDKGQVTGKHYSDVHWDTVESTMLADGSASLTIRYLHMTNKGEYYRNWNWHSDGSKQKRNCKSYWRGNNVDICSRLSHLNGGGWSVEGEVNTTKGTVGVKGNFTISGM